MSEAEGQLAAISSLLVKIDTLVCNMSKLYWLIVGAIVVAVVAALAAIILK